MKYYLLCLGIAFTVSLVLTYVCRLAALKFKVMDIPHSEIKTHREPTPYLGGVAIFAAFWLSILVIRLVTRFPTGTLHAIRGILFGSSIIFILGLVDDVKFKGLGFVSKFGVQITAAILLFTYGIRIKFISPEWFALVVSVVWIVGITNALNILDVMDALASGTALIACLGFFAIGLPSEEEIYVNLASIALVGACAGFIPYNLSKKRKIFMGDTGSLTIGFLLASISLGTSYSHVNTIGVFAPILILAIPIYETLLVTYCRYRRGMLPFLGSRDHYSLRLRKAGFSRNRILLLTYGFGILMSFCAFIVTTRNVYVAAAVYVLVIVFAVILGNYLYRIKID